MPISTRNQAGADVVVHDHYDVEAPDGHSRAQCTGCRETYPLMGLVSHDAAKRWASKHAASCNFKS